MIKKKSPLKKNKNFALPLHTRKIELIKNVFWKCWKREIATLYNNSNSNNKQKSVCISFL